MKYIDPMSKTLTYLGVLAARTEQGRKAVAVCLTGAVELYHIIDAGFASGSEIVRDWLWTAGINPEEAACSFTYDMVISEVLLPEIGSHSLVIAHEDMDIDLVAALTSSLGRIGNPPIVTGIEILGPFNAVTNGAAGKRAFALQGHYEAALESSQKRPAAHLLSGKVAPNGKLQQISVAGPFAQHDWTLDDPEDALFVIMSLAGLLDRAVFNVAPGPAEKALRHLLKEVGLPQRLAA